jgi:hypothetical protein
MELIELVEADVVVVSIVVVGLFEVAIVVEPDAVVVVPVADVLVCEAIVVVVPK